jgi:hypothetical protein
MEDEQTVREMKIIAILNEEVRDGEDLAAEARRLIEYLLLEKKGYAAGEVRKQVVFDVALDKEQFTSSVDFLVEVEGRKAMAIKCSAGSLSSRERQAVAAARLLAAPFAVVADPVAAELLDAATGKVIGEGFGAIPVRDEIMTLVSGKDMEPLTPQKAEREKRILLAFDAIRCSVPKGADGKAIRLDDMCKH